jgi:tetratricopeptide (TPR) repeat protein
MQNLGMVACAEVRAEARRICAELGDRVCVAAAYRIEANSLAATGEPAAARPLYTAVLEIANEIGNMLEKLNALTGLAYTEKMQGDLKAAEADYRAALAVGSEMGPQKKYPVSLELADVLAAEGRVAESRALGEEALEDSRQSSDQESIGLSEAILAHDFALEGRFPDAIARYNEAVRIAREVHEPFQLIHTLLDFGDAQLEQGDAAGARKSFEEARDLDRQGSRAFARPEIGMAFARLSLATGQAEEAVTQARSAMKTFTTAGREGDRLQAAALLARALLARGRIGEASEILAQIPSPEGKSFPLAAVVQFRIARCFLTANDGRRAEAGRAMDTIVTEVSRLGLPPLEKETRLAREALLKTANSH